jgi:trehalose 6-phosphate phosphatase
MREGARIALRFVLTNKGEKNYAVSIVLPFVALHLAAGRSPRRVAQWCNVTPGRVKMALPFLDCSAQRLDEIVQRRLLCVFDFDGTLAPIAARPEEVRVPLGLLLRMRALSAYAPVAVLSGRSLSDIYPRLEFEPDFVAGNQGMEGLPGGERCAKAYRPLCHAWEQTLSAALGEQALPDQGIWIENKGYSLAIHYRSAPNPVKTKAQLAGLIRGLLPHAQIIEGKCVFNLLPPGAGTKGTALEQLMQVSGAGSAVYIGDDVTDEAAFRLRRPDLLTVRIGPGTNTAAEFFLPDQRDMFQALDDLIGRLHQAQARNWLHTAPVDAQCLARG